MRQPAKIRPLAKQPGTYLHALTPYLEEGAGIRTKADLKGKIVGYAFDKIHRRWLGLNSGAYISEFEVYLVVGLAYLAVILSISLLSARLESRMALYHSKGC